MEIKRIQNRQPAFASTVIVSRGVKRSMNRLSGDSGNFRREQFVEFIKELENGPENLKYILKRVAVGKSLLLNGIDLTVENTFQYLGKKFNIRTLSDNRSNVSFKSDNFKEKLTALHRETNNKVITDANSAKSRYSVKILGKTSPKATDSEPLRRYNAWEHKTFI